VSRRRVAPTGRSSLFSLQSPSGAILITLSTRQRHARYRLPPLFSALHAPVPIPPGPVSHHHGWNNIETLLHHTDCLPNIYWLTGVACSLDIQENAEEKAKEKNCAKNPAWITCVWTFAKYASHLHAASSHSHATEIFKANASSGLCRRGTGGPSNKRRLIRCHIDPSRPRTLARRYTVLSRIRLQLVKMESHDSAVGRRETVSLVV
jgi:hypothetical protein